MKTLFILRHAEAAPGSPDQQRVLTAAGRDAAANLGAIMREKSYSPAAILCSPATRTRETLNGLGLQGPKPVFKPEIYHADISGLLALLWEVDADSALLVGHNPAIHGLAASMAGEGPEELLQSVRSTFMPATLAVYKFRGKWADLAPGQATLSDLIVG
jgi:phosphohistidine phosphatase